MSHQRMCILVVDDELTARLLMRAALEKSGFEVCLAENGEDALRQIRIHPCDLVMLDVEMPGMSGYQVCAQLRHEVSSELPIIMVTGMDDYESIEKAFAAGATDFISKPISWGLIGHRVKYLLRAYCVLQDLHASNARNLAILNAIPDLLFEMDFATWIFTRHSTIYWPRHPTNSWAKRSQTFFRQRRQPSACQHCERRMRRAGLLVNSSSWHYPKVHVGSSFLFRSRRGGSHKSLILLFCRAISPRGKRPRTGSTVWPISTP